MTKGKDPLSYSNPAWHARQARWKHNSFFGHCAMARSNMQAILAASTTTEHSKALAAQIDVLAAELAETLKERKDG